MSTRETSTETPSRWGAFTKGAIGTVVLAVGGYVGAAMMQVISAPKDSVAYDFIQSATGMLKPDPAERPASTSESRPLASTPSSPSAQPESKVALAPNPATAVPADAGPAKTAPNSPPPSSPSPAPASSPGQAASEPSPSTAPTSTSPQPAPAGTMLERVQKTAELARQAQASTAALASGRVLSLVDRAKTPICGSSYELEVSSVAAGAGEVALRRPGASEAPVRLAVGQQPKELGPGCRIVLLSTMEDLTNRRAQLHETVSR